MRVSTPQETVSSALGELCAQLGISETDFGGELDIQGKDPVVASRHHLGESTAVLLADLPLVTARGPLGEMSVLPPQVELSEFKLGPRFSGDPNGASKLDWKVFGQNVLAPAFAQAVADSPAPPAVLVSA